MSKAHKIQQAWTEGKPKYVFGFGDQHGHYGFSATLQRGDVYVELEALEALQQQVEQLQQENERLKILLCITLREYIGQMCYEEAGIEDSQNDDDAIEMWRLFMKKDQSDFPEEVS